MEKNEKSTNKPRKPKLSKKRKRREKTYDRLNKFFKKSVNDLKKLSKKEEQTTITLALDLTGNSDVVIEEIIFKHYWDEVKTLEGYKVLHSVCKGMDKYMHMEVSCKTFRAPQGPNTSYVPKIKFDLTKPYDPASFDDITIYEPTEPPEPYHRKKKR